MSETEASPCHTLLSKRGSVRKAVSHQKVKDLNQLTLTNIIEATNNEDPLCIEIVEEVGYKLGRYIAG